MKYKKPKVVAGIIAVIGCVVFVLYLLTTPINAPKADDSASKNTQNQQKNGGNGNTENLKKLTDDQAVATALFSLGDLYAEGECMAEGHIILGYDESDSDKKKIYALTTISWYGFENNNFVQISGGAFPAVITVGKEHSVGIELPTDGSDYGESIGKLFPMEYHDRIFSHEEADRDNLKQQELEYAEAYLSKIGREAEIGAYADFSYTSLTEVGVSVEVSNIIQSFYKEHSNYPSFVGTRERLEEGTRMVYQMSHDAVEDEIRFTKYMYDSEEIIEEFVLDAATGT